MICKSLTVGRRERFDASYSAVWASDNARVPVSAGGWLTAPVDAKYPNGIANITATEDGDVTSFRATIVPWSANRVSLEPVESFDNAYTVTKDGARYLLSVMNTGTTLYESTDDLATLTPIGTLPEPQYRPPMLATQNGYFFRGLRNVYHSADLAAWTAVMTAAADTLCLKNGFSFYDDSVTGITYVYTGEYHTVNSKRSKVYRGTILPDGTQTWETVLEFYSHDELAADPELAPACWHVHAVITDDATGDVYVCTGDTNAESHIMRSTDRGATWTVVGEGSQDWRTLSMWFTDTFIYWGMDGGTTQEVFRIERAWLATMTTAEIDAAKETVASLDTGSMWYHLWVKNHLNEDAVILGCAQEGSLRDRNARVFMFSNLEAADVDDVETEEVFLAVSATPDEVVAFLQMEPYCQDADGYVYMNGRQADPATMRKFEFATYGVSLPYTFQTPTEFRHRFD